MVDLDSALHTDKKPDDKKEPVEKSTPGVAAGTSTRIGDGAHHDTSGGGAHDSPEDAFHAAIGLDAANKGNTARSVEQFSTDIGRSSNGSPGRNVTFTDANNKTYEGGQYHNKDGSFFVTPEATYKIERTDNGYTLQPTKEGQTPIEATRRDVQANSFSRWQNRGNDGDGADNGNGGQRNRTPRDADPNAVAPADKSAAAVATPGLNAGAVNPGAANDRLVAAVAPAVSADRVVTAPAVSTDRVAAAPVVTTAGGDHATPLPATTPARMDPTTFYNSFKGASDQTQRDLIQQNLSSIPRDQRRDFIKQVTEVGISTDKGGALDVIKDLRQTVGQVARSGGLENNAVPAPVVADRTPKPGDAQPAAQPLVAAAKGDNPQPAVVAAGQQPKIDNGTQIRDALVAPVAGNLGQFVKPSDRADRSDRAAGPDVTPQVIKALNQGDPQFVKQNADPAVRITTAVEGALVRDGKGGPNNNQIPGGDSFKPEGPNRGIPGQQGPDRVDPSVLIGKLQNPGAGQNPVAQLADKLGAGPDGKQLQPVQIPIDVRGQHGPGDGKDNPGAQIAARAVGGDQAQPVLPQQKNMIPGLDLNDPQTKQFLADALKQIQATKVGDFDPRNQNQNLQDILKGFDPHKVERLQAFLNPDGKGQISDAAVGKLASILSPAAERLTGTGATDITLGQRTAVDRLTELVRGNQNLIDLQTLQTRDGRLLLEINRMVGDVNKQFGFEGKNVLTLSDIIGRSLDGTKGGERGLGLEAKGALGPTNLDPLSFTAKMSPQQEQAIRAFLDMKDARLAEMAGKANLDTHTVQRTTDALNKNEPLTKIETNTKAELANRLESKHEPVARELANKELPGKELSGKELPGKELAGKEIAGKPETGKPELTGKELSAKTELGTKSELGAKGELAGRPDVTRPDFIIRPDIKDKDERGDKLDAHSPFNKHDNTLGTNLDGSKKVRDDKELAEKQKDEKERLEEDHQRKEAAMMALMADRKIREDKEKQQKEQEKLQDKKQQDEDTRRRRYVVRERDTLESIASKQHRDGKLAPLIYDLNKKEIAMKMEHGREVPDLRARQVIWLPSGVDIREFRKRMSSGSTAQSSGDEKITAEDELAARFGSNWAGTTSGDDTENGGAASVPSAPVMTPEAVAAAQARRANIENLLGPLSKQKPVDGRIRYVVRLGDTLKTVAMKHPSLQDISLWVLLAEVNEISIETDEKGIPLARLLRGSTVMIPTIEEIQLYRDQHGTRANPAARATKSCPHCGRMSSLGASICGACAHSFNLDSKPQAASDAGMVVMQAAGFVQKPGVPLAKRPVPPPDTVDLQIQPVLPAPLYPEGSQLAVVQLDEQTRLTRCMMHGEIPSTVVVIEVSQGDAWKAVVAYEIFSQSSMRHEYNPRGERKSVKIDLPTEAILELSNNDLKTNWKNYRDRYFAQLVSLNL